MTNKKVMIEGRDLVIGYGSSPPILNGISFDIYDKDRFIILGESGSGKSTLLKAIIGLNPAREGSVKFMGRELNYPIPENDSFYKDIGILFQNSALLNSMTIEENVMLPINMHYPKFSPKVALEIAREKLFQVNLYEHRKKYPPELSGGMKKRAALARAMVTDPKIIFFDEPQAGLDPVTAKGMDELFVKMNEDLGITLVTVTHELLSIKRAGKTILMIADKKILFLGSLDEALNSDIFRVKRFFNVDKFS